MMLRLHGNLEAIGLPRDLIGESASLDGYKLLLSSFLPYVSEHYLNSALQFVQKWRYMDNRTYDGLSH